MEHKTFILKDNSSEIRKKIRDAGIRVCVCASFDSSRWLNYSTRVANGVHGVGGSDDFNEPVDVVLARFVFECNNPVYCENVDDFIRHIKEFEENK